MLINDPRFAPAGVLAPKSKADLAFIMHSLSWLASNGTAAIVCFPGIMYRGGAEKKIRQYLIDNNFIDCVIQLPSPELRSKKQLIETFIAGVNDVDDVMTEWHDFVSTQREKELSQIIQEEKLREPETRKFLESAFRDGEIKTTGTDIDRLMPPVSRFGGGGARAKKKQSIIEKLKQFFERFFGIGGSSFKSEK